MAVPNYCPYCNAKVLPGAKFCIHCGQKLPEVKTKKCPNCGNIVRENEKYCYKCGFPLSSGEERHFAVFIAPEIEKKICQICYKPIERDLVFCPNCLNPFHVGHLYSWVKKEGSCPICKTKLIVQE